MENAEYKVRKNNIDLNLKYIQHGETRKMFYLQNLIPDGDLKFWNNLFDKDIQNITKEK